MVKIDRNEVVLCGRLMTIEESHILKDDTFYKAVIAVEHRRNFTNYIPVIVEDRNITGNLKIGELTIVFGEFRTLPKKDIFGTEGIMAYVHAKEIKSVDTICELNSVKIIGTVSRTPLLVKSGDVDITSVIVAVNRTHGKSSYIPCLCIDKNSEKANKLKVGDKVFVKGLFQSRFYKYKKACLLYTSPSPRD